MKRPIAPRSFVHRSILSLFLALGAGPTGFAAELLGDPGRGAARSTGDHGFCREVLILHHSHVDVGYTHPQSMYWELQKTYLEAALDLLDRTESWPDDRSRPRWTAEATAPLLRWLETAAPTNVARFRRHVKSGRFGISGLEYNTTPLCSEEGLARQLYPVRALRERFGADIRTVHQHDVTGIPWTAVDLLLDARIELLVMGINLHLSGTPLPRPAVYRWRGPSGRELLVMNGEHYSMFDQWTDPASRDLDTIQQGLGRYLRHLRDLGYPYDFVYLTATCAPYMYDNSPPNQELPDLVRLWNEEGREPLLRLVTPAELLARLRRIPNDDIPVVSGDWTDYWNFGSGSSAVETRLTRQCTANASAIDLLRTVTPDDRATVAAMERLWSDIHLYNEHTWGAHNSLDADHPFVVTQWHLKAAPAYDGKPLSDYHLRWRLHRLAGNAWQSRRTDGVLIVNPSGLRQDYFVPGTWSGNDRRIESTHLTMAREATVQPVENPRGPVTLEPWSWRIVPWDRLPAAPAAESIRTHPDSIETRFHRLAFDPLSGRVTGLFDKVHGRAVTDGGSPWGFFQLVHERPANRERSAFHVRSVEGERYGRTGWKPEWTAVRTGPSEPGECRVERHPRSVTLVARGRAEGLTDLEQRITLHADSPVIDLHARFKKEDVRTPEAVYFAFPLDLPDGWRAHFDTAGVPTELDHEQIPGTCRDWVTVDTFAAVHAADFGATLYCPDAPLVQIGGFHWALDQDAIPRRARPILLAWPLNNYWETNFRASQPGIVEVHYRFVSHGAFDARRAMLEGRQARQPPVTHPVFALDETRPHEGAFVSLQDAPAVVLHVKPAEDGRGTIVRLVAIGDAPVTARLSLPGRRLAGAWLCGTLEDRRQRLDRSGEAALCPLEPRRVTTVRLVAR